MDVLANLPSIGTLTTLGLAALCLRRAYYVATGLWKIRGVPIYWCLIDPMSPFSGFFPRTWWNPMLIHAWTHMHRYEERDTEILYIVPLLLGVLRIHVASPELVKEQMVNLKVYTKPELALSIGTLMGPNVVASVGEQWRRHRKITAPAFDGQIYIDVWNTTSRLYAEMLNSEAWRISDSHYFESFNVFTTRMALLVIADSGFNLRIGWNDNVTREGLPNPVDSTIVTVSSNLLPLIGLPRWIFKLPIEGLRKLMDAAMEMQQFLDLEVKLKKEEIANDKQLHHEITAANRNLFARVVMASEEEGSKGLSHEEIIGNLFIYLFAGHETTASTLAATLALLAGHQDEQQRVYEYIKSVVGDRDMTYDDYNALASVQHCFYETLRLYPAGNNMLRVNPEDTTLFAPHLTPTSDTIFVPKGTQFALDLISTNRNPRYFSEPHEFRPRRWEDPSMVDNFLGFSTGPRLCLGKKFSTVEAVAFLSNALRDWKFDIKLEKGETLEQWKKRVLTPTIEITLKLEHVPLLVTRRR